MAATVTVVTRDYGLVTNITFDGVDSWEEEDRFLTFYDDEDNALGLVLADSIQYMYVNGSGTESFRAFASE